MSVRQAEGQKSDGGTLTVRRCWMIRRLPARLTGWVGYLGIC